VVIQYRRTIIRHIITITGSSYYIVNEIINSIWLILVILNFNTPHTEKSVCKDEMIEAVNIKKNLTVTKYRRVNLKRSK
jgi:hypothetical protein